MEIKKKRFNIDLDDSAFTKERTPIKPQFQSSGKGANSTPSTSGSSTSQPLSYAEFVIRQNKPAPDPQIPSVPQGECISKQATDLGTGVSSETQLPRATMVQAEEYDEETISKVFKEREETQTAADTQKQVNNQSSESGPFLGPRLAGSSSSIIVSPRQRGNPILKFVRSVPWEFGEVVPDYVLGQTACALFLSLRYHNLNPNYIHERLKQLGQTFTLRVLLVQVDVKDPHHSLKELARMCIMADCTLILAWSPEEAGRYLETYKSYEKKPADILKEHVDRDYLSKVTDCLTTVKSVNKTDAMTLLSTFSSVEGIVNASREDLVLCPGFGPQKARRLYDVLHQPFLKLKKKDS